MNRCLLGLVLLASMSESHAEAAKSAVATGQSNLPADTHVVTPQEAARIKKLITDLATIDAADAGLCWGKMAGTTFAPVEGTGTFRGGLIMDHQEKTSPIVLELVHLGPKALVIDEWRLRLG